MNAIPGPMPHTPEWDALRFYDPDRTERPVIFGASEAAAACGMSPYQTPLEMYLVKRRDKLPPDDNEAMEAGRFLETGVISWYEHRTGRRVQTNCPMYLHETHPFMGATPDGIANEGGSSPALKKLAVDAKCSTYRRYDEFAAPDEDKFGKEGTDQMPVDCVLQAQQQCEVLGIEKVDFPALFDGRTLRIYTVPRDEQLISMIVSAERELAERIVNADPPPPNWSHESTSKLIGELFGYTPQKAIQLESAQAEAWTEYQRLGFQIKDLEDQRRECRNKVLWAMGDAELGKLPAGAKELRRVAIAESRYTEQDVEKMRERVGQVKRKGYVRLLERKVK